MVTKMKGLLKGLRYISQIFENEKEQEMQIGYPTDVKHVAHIGWDGLSINSPSWMNDFKSTSSGPLQSSEEAKTIAAKSLSHDFNRITEKSKISRRHRSADLPSPIESPQIRLLNKPKHSRHHHSSDSPVDSPTAGGSTKGRRHKGSNLGVDSSSQDSPTIPKHSRRRKSKGSDSAS